MRPVIARSAFMLAPLLLAACGLNGTDKDTDQKQADKTAASAPTDPDLAEFETSDVRDTDPRPIMQAQVVLDAQGFGPGVIDGGMGMSTRNALKGFQEANGLQVSGELDAATKQALAKWSNVPATRVIRIPESWGQVEFAKVPDEPEDQAKMKHLGYENIAEKLAERFHTTPDVLKQLNPGGQPAGSPTTAASGTTNVAEGAPAYPPRTSVTPTPGPSASGTTDADADAETPAFRPGQLVRVPNIGLDGAPAAAAGDDQDWQRTLASLGVKAQQPKAARIVVDKSDGTLKAYDGGDKLLAMFTVTSGSSHDPLPLGDWKINVVSKNPPFHYNPDLFWDADATDEKATLPPGPNGPVGVVWIDLSKEHYGIHGTAEPQTIGRSQSHGCVRLTNWDAARLAQMVDTSTKVVFQA